MKPTLTIIAGTQANFKANDNREEPIMDGRMENLNNLSMEFENGIRATVKNQMLIACHNMAYTTNEIMAAQAKAMVVTAMGVVRTLPDADALKLLDDIATLSAYIAKTKVVD